MASSSDESAGLTLAGHSLPSSLPSQFPVIVSRAGKAAVFASEEFFFGRLRNPHTRQAYLIAVRRFLHWAEAQGLELSGITPKDVGMYLDGLRNESTSVATRKQHLAALRHYFDALVTRHAIILNPALSVRGERYQVVEGKTPELTVAGARTLLASLDTGTLAGLRDRAVIGLLVYTGCRPGPWPPWSGAGFIMPAGSGCFTFRRRAANSGRYRSVMTWSRCLRLISKLLGLWTLPNALPCSARSTAGLAG